MTDHPKRALLVFAKAPIAGHAKTRLIPALGDKQAAQLHEKLALHTLNTLIYSTIKEAQCRGTSMWDTHLWCAGNMDHDFFQRCDVQYKIDLFCQTGDDLGQRMFNAANASLQHYDEICIVGTDCPALELSDIKNAFEALKQSHLVINPAEDGGYVLIAANKIDKRIFEKVPWGTQCVMEKTLKNIEQLDWTLQCLKTLWDVDIPQDLLRLNQLFPEIAI